MSDFWSRSKLGKLRFGPKKIAHPNWLGNISKCQKEGPKNTLKQKNCI